MPLLLLDNNKPLLQTQGLPEGTGKVINSFGASPKRHLRKGKESPQGSGKESLLNTVNMQVAELPAPGAPALSLSWLQS